MFVAAAKVAKCHQDLPSYLCDKITNPFSPCLHHLTIFHSLSVPISDFPSPHHRRLARGASAGPFTTRSRDSRAAPIAPPPSPPRRPAVRLPRRASAALILPGTLPDMLYSLTPCRAVRDCTRPAPRRVSLRGGVQASEHVLRRRFWVNSERR